MSPHCACVHTDAYECARIRDQRMEPYDPDYHEPERRACICDCHDKEDNEFEDYP